MIDKKIHLELKNRMPYQVCLNHYVSDISHVVAVNPDKLLFKERSLDGDILPLDYKVEYESLTMYYHSDRSREHYNYREGLLCLD